MDPLRAQKSTVWETTAAQRPGRDGVGASRVSRRFFHNGAQCGALSGVDGKRTERSRELSNRIEGLYVGICPHWTHCFSTMAPNVGPKAAWTTEEERDRVEISTNRLKAAWTREERPSCVESGVADNVTKSASATEPTPSVAGFSRQPQEAGVLSSGVEGRERPLREVERGPASGPEPRVLPWGERYGRRRVAWATKSTCGAGKGSRRSPY